MSVQLSSKRGGKVIIDFVIGNDAPLFEVIRDENGRAVQVDIDYRLTLLQVHHEAKSQLTDSEYLNYSEIMQPKPACQHLPSDHVETRGYLKGV